MSCNCDGKADPRRGPNANPRQAGHRVPPRPTVTVYNNTPAPNYAPTMPPYSDYPDYPNYPYHPY